MSTEIGGSRDHLIVRLTRASRHGDHTLLYLRFHQVEERHDTDLRRALEHVAARLCGPVTVGHLGGADYALLLECWSLNRSLQLAALLGTAVQRGFRRLGAEVWMDVGPVPVRGELDAEELLAKAARACGSASRSDTPLWYQLRAGAE